MKDRFVISNKVILAVFLSLMFTNFFGALFLPTGNWLKAIGFCIIFYCIIQECHHTALEEKVLLIITGLIIITCIYSSSILDQNSYYVSIYTLVYTEMCSFFVYKRLHLSANEAKSTLMIISCLMITGYFIQWLLYPRYILFWIAQDDINITDENFRMRFYCTACAYLILLYGVNKYLLERKKKHLLWTFVGGFPVVMMEFRSLTIITITSIVIMVAILSVKKKRFIQSWVFVSVVALLITQIPLVQDKIDKMIIRNDSGQNFSNKEYVRYLALEYYVNNFSEDPLTWIIGGGTPLTSSETGYKRGNSYEHIFIFGNNVQLFWVDLGLIGLSFIIGIPTVLLIVILCLRYVWQCKENDMLYIRFTLLTILVGSIVTSMELYRSGNFIILGLIFYYVYKYKQEKKYCNGNRNTNFS